jgi:hypothetical protein
MQSQTISIKRQIVLDRIICGAAALEYGDSVTAFSAALFSSDRIYMINTDFL